MFKDVTIKGELYSSEFQQLFNTNGSVCSLKEKLDGKFDFKIDGISHISWFRRKKYEFMEALRMPTRKQNKGIIVSQNKVRDNGMPYHGFFVLLQLD